MSKKSEYLKQYRADTHGKTKRVSVSLSLAEFKTLKKMADVEKKKPTALLKELAFSSLDHRANYPLDVSADLGDLVHILRGVGNNINQIARHANTFKKVVDENDVLLKLHIMEEEIKNFLNRQ